MGLRARPPVQDAYATPLYPEATPMARPLHVDTAHLHISGFDPRAAGGRQSIKVELRASVQKYRDAFWDDVIGRFPKATESMNPRTRKVHDEPKFTVYEVTVDVWPDVFCFGILLVPKDIKPGERRPVVVCYRGGR